MRSEPHTPGARAGVARKPAAIFILEPDKLDQVYGPEARSQLAERLTVKFERLTPENFLAIDPGLLADVEVIVTGWGMPRLDDACLARLPRLRALFFAAGSVRSFMTDQAWDRGIRVTTAASVNAVPVAEFSFAQIILSLKRVWSQSAAVRNSRNYFRESTQMPGSYRSTVGLLSLGAIGRRVARWLAETDINVIAFDPYIAPRLAEEMGVQLVSLEEIFRQADVVSCHLPWLPATERMLGAKQFSLMKRGATFINTARGAVVAENELVSVLRERPDLFALLDVVHPDPPWADSPFFELPNVVLTPHIAGSMDRECERMGLMMADEVGRFLRGDVLLGEINRQQAALLA